MLIKRFFISLFFEGGVRGKGQEGLSQYSIRPGCKESKFYSLPFGEAVTN